ncbi:amidoligase family protein [Woeseia oceani]|nr:amidoligase family protein [Woeseia oceani]
MEVDMPMDFNAWSVPLPAAMHTASGKPRRIGVELEMIGLSVSEVSRMVASHLNGKVREDTPYEHFITGDDAGEWGVELDYAYLKELGREQPADVEMLAVLNEVAEGVLRAGAEAIVPVEIVSPPLPIQRLADIQALIARLRSAGAKGSGAGVTYAFGMQFNPELPDLEAATISGYLKAFFCLYDWLAARSKVDLTRRLTGFSAAFPESYVRKVVDPEYWPDQAQLIDDYLSDNPSRNRALDMLPLFMHLDEKRLRAVVDDPRVKPRPTLHYRLPNCEIHRKDWGIHLAWGDWLVVESLAADRDRLNNLCSAYAAWLDKPLSRLFDNWADEVAAMPGVSSGT